MNKEISYKQYIKCFQDVFFKPFYNKEIFSYFIFALIFLFIGIISNIFLPFILKEIIQYLSSTNIEPVPWVLPSYGLIWTVSQIAFHLRALLTSKIEQRVTFAVGSKVFTHLYTLSHRYFLNQKPGAITNVVRRAQRDVPTIILGIFFHVIPTLIEFIVVVVLILTLYPFLYSFLLTGTLFVFSLFTFFSMKFSLEERLNANEVDKHADGIIVDWLSNLEIVKIFGKRNLAIDICNAELKKREKAEIKFLTKLNITRLGQALILGVGLTLLTYCIGQGVLKGELSIGDFILFNGYIIQFMMPLNVLGHVTQEIKKAVADIKGVFNILLAEPEINEHPHPFSLSGNNFPIECRNVSFKYDEIEILKDISFEVESGQTAFIIGPSGIGKSTIAKLLLRLYDPTKGQIFINKINIKNLSFDSLYKAIGLVPQETQLLNDTIKNNVRLASQQVTCKEIEEALDKAYLLDFVRSLPKGLNTHVGEKGLKLSGGEKQRLSLARIFLKKPKICIFDEPTSFLDKKTENVIDNNIKNYLPDITKIIITHQIFEISKIDKIILLDEKGLHMCDNTQHPGYFT